ncbi:MAG: hypothetical protein Q8R08_01065 [bacterium]|nr:hypothetical protein [bacterium]
MINEHLIEKNHKRLREEKQHLENLLSHIANKDPKVGDLHTAYPNFGDQPDENASEVADYEEKIAEEFDLEQKLRRVEGALLRIDKGTYGVCLIGGEAITQGRLEAIPEAENCVEHQPL